MKYFLVIFFVTWSLNADVKSITGNILFDIESDQTEEAILNSIGLGIGVSPSSNLHVAGNAKFSETLFVGTNSGSSNLVVSGTIGHSVQMVNSDTTLNEHSIVLADTSSDNITLTLPSASSATGRQIRVKKKSDLNQLWITSSDNIDGFDSRIELTSSTSGLPYVNLISSGTQWLILSQSSDALNVIGADNLFSWWKLDELSGSIADDSSGQGRHGTINNLTSSNLGISGIFGTAFNFDGDDDYIEVTNVDPPHTASISLWIKRDSLGLQRVLGSDDAFEFRLHSDDTINNDFFGAGSTTLEGSTLTDIVNWHHIVMTYDFNSNALQIYLDGELDANNSLGDDDPGGPFTLRLGHRTGANSSQYYDGLIDDIRIYDKVLTANEIEGLYQQR